MVLLPLASILLTSNLWTNLSNCIAVVVATCKVYSIKLKKKGSNLKKLSCLPIFQLILLLNYIKFPLIFNTGSYNNILIYEVWTSIFKRYFIYHNNRWKVDKPIIRHVMPLAFQNHLGSHISSHGWKRMSSTMAQSTWLQCHKRHCHTLIVSVEERKISRS